jgi:hypothetical protein
VSTIPFQIPVYDRRNPQVPVPRRRLKMRVGERLFITFPSLCVALSLCLLFPQAGKTEENDFAPLLLINSIDKKVLDVCYTFNYESFSNNKKINTGRRVIHLVFDSNSGKFREETKWYDNPNDTNTYLFAVEVWNGKEALSWHRPVAQLAGFRALGEGRFETPGSATISAISTPQVPYFLSMYYEEPLRPIATMALLQHTKCVENTETKIVLETIQYRFEFSKKNGALEKLVSSAPVPGRDPEKLMKMVTYEFFRHVNVSGILMPLEVKIVRWDFDGNLMSKGEFHVDQKKLRLYDKIDDNTFQFELNTGCLVNDQIRKREYRVTTLAANPPQDVEAMKKTLEKMLEQAEEQKAAVEKKK